MGYFFKYHIQLLGVADWLLTMGYMMKTSLFTIFMALSIIILNGCTGTSSVSTRFTEPPVTTKPPAAAANLKQELVTLSDQTRLLELRGEGDVSGDIIKLRGDIQRLATGISAVGGSATLELRQHLDSINARVDQLERAAAARAAAPQKPLDTSLTASGADGTVPLPPSAPGSPLTAEQSSNTPYPRQPGDAQAKVVQPKSTTPVPPPPVGTSGSYEKGKSAFDEQQYGVSLTNFKDYLAKEPKGTNAAAAHFYVGEAYYAQKKYMEAILEYQKVIRSFPKSSQVPTSILKQGISFQALGDTDGAKLLYNKVIRDYPKSYAAGVAKDRLKKI